ncbi:DUF4185 domain-containing protein [Williamsia herbipolensis]|uniref:DUF4185 domain-containing protein n=1 Tax=Williamsia herbipolensis TaxID=1603258 RepID=A0AAU4K5P8_9NOCA|nr:DUF4185 domain-containing protein [Williamsia herbipolensis]MCX6471069.1 DUF4185 domain-containing protein [Mycobacteriales bacterium]
MPVLRRSAVLLTTVCTAAATLVGLGVAGTASAAPCGNAGLLGSSPLGNAIGNAFGSFGSSGGPLLGKSSSQGPLPTVNGGNTTPVAWVTGAKSPNNTEARFGISGTDLGIAWDNGTGQTLMAFGDTFGNCNAAGQQWRHNLILRTTDTNPADGVTIGNGVPGDVRSGAVVGSGAPTFATESIPALEIAGVEVTTIPTAAIAIDGKQYMNYMSVRQWGGPGRWVTNSSAIAVSSDNGQTWATQPQTVRLNLPVTVPGVEQVDDSNGKYQQNAYLRGHDDPYIYQYGTPNGRFGAAFLCRFLPGNILDLSKYQYYTGDSDPTKTWSPDTTKSKAVVTEPVSELSVAWNNRLQRYVMLYGNETTGNLVMRTATAPQGPFSAPTTLLTSQQLGGVYAPYIYPSNGGNDQYLYFTASRWLDYNVMMMRTDLSRIPVG